MIDLHGTAAKLMGDHEACNECYTAGKVLDIYIPVYIYIFSQIVTIDHPADGSTAAELPLIFSIHLSRNDRSHP